MGQVSTRVLREHLHQVVGAVSADQVSDRHLLERFARERDEEAFAQIVRRHGPLVLGVCRQVLRHEQDAEDAFQATFLVLSHKIKAIHWQRSVAGWLHEVAFRVASKARGQEARQRVREREMREARKMPVAMHNEREALWLILHEEVRALPDLYREPVVLCYLEGLSHDQAARQLGWPIGTVKGRLARARQQLQERLARRGITSLGVSPLILTVPTPLSRTATQAASLVAEGKIPTGLASSRALALAQSVLTALPSSRFTLALVLTLTFGLLVGSSAVVGHQQPGDPRANPPLPAIAAPPPPAPGKPVREEQPLPEGALQRLGNLDHFRPGGRVHDAAYSPDGKTLALAGERVITLWDLARQKEIRRLEAYTENDAVRFSPDGKLLAATASTAKVVTLWEVATGLRVGQIHHPEWVHLLAFAPDGKTLATATSGPGERALYLWEVPSGRKLRKFVGHTKQISALTFSPDGTTLASAGFDSTVQLWDLASGKQRHRLAAPALPGYKGWVNAVAYSPDGKTLVSGHGDSRFRVWDPRTGKKLREVVGHTDGVSGICFAPDGKALASGSADNTIRLWDTSTWALRRTIEGRERPGGMFSLAYSPDGKTLVSWGALHTVRFWDVQTGKERWRVPGHQSQVVRVRFSADGKTVLSWGADRTLWLWNLKTRRQRCLAVGDRWGTDDYALAFSPDSQRLAIGTAEAVITLWDCETGKRVRQFKGHRQWVTGVAYSPDGRLLASASTWDRTIRVWEVSTGKQVQRWEALPAGSQDGIRALAFSPDGKTLVTGGNTPVIQVWEVASGKVVQTFKGHAGQRFGTMQVRPVYLAFLPDGEHVVSARITDGLIRLWEVSTGRQVRTFEQPLGNSGVLAYALALSPSGRTLAVSGPGGTLTLWEVATGKKIRELHEHEDDIHSLAFSPDGRQLASGSKDTTILVWDMTGGAVKRETALPPREIDRLWEQLGSADASTAQSALWRLVATPEQALALLKKRVKPIAAPVDAKQVAKLVQDLDSPEFVVRDRASAALAKMGPGIERALQQELAKKPGPEVRHRLERLLAQLRQDPEKVRVLRALEVLEQIGTPEARKLLKTLAGGAPGAWLTREATRASRRLAQHGTGSVK